MTSLVVGSRLGLQYHVCITACGMGFKLNFKKWLAAATTFTPILHQWTYLAKLVITVIHTVHGRVRLSMTFSS